METYAVEKAVSPVDGSVVWLVLDAETLMPVPEVREFSLYLRGAGRAENTRRAYVPRVARFLNWCAAQGVDWRTVDLPTLSRFKHWLETDRLPTEDELTATREGLRRMIRTESSR